MEKPSQDSRPVPRRRRIALWAAILAAAGVALGVIWHELNPLEMHPVIREWWFRHNLRLLASSDPATGVRGWTELRRLYHRWWWGYDRVVWQVKQDAWQADSPSIRFRLVGDGSAFVATADATRPGDCRTVQDAMMAILYGEPTRLTPFRGDWWAWWVENEKAYPNRYRRPRPSGPEPEPRGR